MFKDPLKLGFSTRPFQKAKRVCALLTSVGQMFHRVEAVGEKAYFLDATHRNSWQMVFVVGLSHWHKCSELVPLK